MSTPDDKAKIVYRVEIQFVGGSRGTVVVDDIAINDNDIRASKETAGLTHIFCWPKQNILSCVIDEGRA